MNICEYTGFGKENSYRFIFRELRKTEKFEGHSTEGRERKEAAHCTRKELMDFYSGAKWLVNEGCRSNLEEQEKAREERNARQQEIEKKQRQELDNFLQSKYGLKIEGGFLYGDTLGGLSAHSFFLRKLGNEQYVMGTMGASERLFIIEPGKTRFETKVVGSDSFSKISFDEASGEILGDGFPIDMKTGTIKGLPFSFATLLMMKAIDPNVDELLGGRQLSAFGLSRLSKDILEQTDLPIDFDDYDVVLADRNKRIFGVRKKGKEVDLIDLKARKITPVTDIYRAWELSYKKENPNADFSRLY